MQLEYRNTHEFFYYQIFSPISYRVMNKKLKKEIIRWDINSWSRALNFWETHINWNSHYKCLELGGREGGLSLWLALKGNNVICSDLDHVNELAAPLHRSYQVDSLITYEDIDATNIPYTDYFDVIVFKSILGGVGKDNRYDRQLLAFQQISRALKPGGKLLFAENLKASFIHQILRKRFIRWGTSWRYISLSEMDALMSNFSSCKIKSAGVLGVLGRNEGQRKFFYFFDKYFLNKLCPDTWKYLAFGIAEK